MLILYIGDKHFSGWSMRGRIILMEKAVPFEERLVELDWPTTETPDGTLVVGDGNSAREAHAGCECEFSDLAELDTEGLLTGTHLEQLPRVPILVDTESRAVVSDVIAIAEYLDERFPDSGARLVGRSSTARAQIRSIASWAYHDLGSLVYGASYAKSLRSAPGTPDPAAIEQSDWLCDVVTELLSRKLGAYLLGDFSLADVMLTTYFQQMRGWGYAIRQKPANEYADRLLTRTSVLTHLDEARAPYRQISAATPGTPQWIVSHYRLNRRHRLLHNWQTDKCVRIANNTAMLAVELAYRGQTLAAISGAISAKYNAPENMVSEQIADMFSELASHNLPETRF